MASVHSLFPDFVRGPGPGVHLDEGLWRNLPRTLAEGLLQFLPLGDRLRLRRVSKSWLDASSAIDPGCGDLEALPIMVGDSSLTIYNARRNAWRHKSMKDVYLNDAVKGFESAGGLICAVTRHSETLLIVHNPITNKTKYLLPPESFMLPCEPQTKRSCLQTPQNYLLYDVALHYEGLSGLFRGMIGFICDEINKSYTIIMASTRRHSPRTTHMYSSLSANWSAEGEVPEGVTFWYGGDCRVVCNESLYCLATGRCTLEGAHECVLAKFSPSSRTWNIFFCPRVQGRETVSGGAQKQCNFHNTARGRRNSIPLQAE